MKLEKSKALWEEGKQYMPSGVSAGGRVNVACGMPHYIDHAHGARLYTVDGEEFIDYHGGSGASMFGHDHPRVKAAIEECLSRGFFMNYDSEKTLEFAKNFTTLVPTVEKFRLLNSGTEATMAAIRIARGYTGKNIIIKMDGHFHGMHEMVWYNHGKYPPMGPDGIVETAPDSNGITAVFTSLVKVAEFNNLDAVAKLVEMYHGDIAAIILEPVVFNMGAAEASPKAEIMDICSPGGTVGVSGTYSGNQLAVWAANECVKMALEPGFYDHIEAVGGKLFTGMEALMKKHGLPGHVHGKGARFAIYWGYDDPAIDQDLRKSQQLFRRDMANAFINGALDNGLYFHSYWDAPIPSHCGFSVQHTLEDIDSSLEKMDKVMAGMTSMV